MKLKVVLLACGYCLIIGGGAIISLEHGIGAAALIGVLHGIIVTLKKHGDVVIIEQAEPGQDQTKKTSKVSDQHSASQSQTKETAAQIAGLNEDIFAKFQNSVSDHQSLQALVENVKKKSVEQSGTASNKKTNVLEHVVQNPYQKSIKQERLSKDQSKLPFTELLKSEQEVKVTLSKHALAATEKKQPPSKKENSKKPSDVSNKDLLNELAKPLEEDPHDLFADVQITLASEESIPNDEEKSIPKSNSSDDILDEGLSGVLHESSSPEEKSAEEAALLKMAKESFQGGNISDAKAALDNYFSTQTEPVIDWEIQYLYAQVCLKLDDVTTATKCFSELTQNGLDAGHPEYSKTLEAITSSLEEKNIIEEALPFLYDLLNYYRQELDRIKMDVTYERIERILEKIGDDERLIRSYKNHLEIKRILKDQYGESHLLDLIGNRYYKMGEKELSRKFYEENLNLKSLLEKVGSP